MIEIALLAGAIAAAGIMAALRGGRGRGAPANPPASRMTGAHLARGRARPDAPASRMMGAHLAYGGGAPAAAGPRRSAMMGTHLTEQGYGAVQLPGRMAPERGRLTRHEAALREPIPEDGRPIVMDSSVALGLMKKAEGRGGRLHMAERYHHRVRIPRGAQEEVDRNLRHGDGYDLSQLPMNEEMYPEDGPDAGCLAALERMHAAAAGAPDSEAAGFWLRAKAEALAGAGFGDPDGLEGGRRAKALRWLYDKAADDRRIVAAAAAIAGGGTAYLLSRDGDMLAFRAQILEATGGRVEVRRPEAAH